MGTEFGRTQPKTLKKISITKIYQSERKFSQKSMFSTLKVERNQKFVWGLLDEIRPGSLKKL
jgi:hypothetical protein